MARRVVAGPARGRLAGEPGASSTAGLVTALVRQRQRRRPRRAGVMVIKPSGVPYDELRPEHLVVVGARRRAGRRGRPATVVGHADPPRALPALPGRRRHRPHPLGGGHRLGPGRPVDPAARDDPRRPLPRRGPGHPDAHRGRGRGRLRGRHRVGHRRDARGGRARPARDAGRRWSRRTGRSPGAPTRASAVDNAIALEAVAAMASRTLALDPDARPMADYLLERHFRRKHGAGAYYGQRPMTATCERGRPGCTAPATSGSRPSQSWHPDRARRSLQVHGRRAVRLRPPLVSRGQHRRRRAEPAAHPRPRVQRRRSPMARGPVNGSSPTRPIRASDATACRAGRSNLCAAGRFAGFTGTRRCPAHDDALAGVACSTGCPTRSRSDEATLLEPLGVALHALDLARGPGRRPGRRLRLRSHRAPARPAPAPVAAPRSSSRPIAWRTGWRPPVRWGDRRVRRRRRRRRPSPAAATSVTDRSTSRSRCRWRRCARGCDRGRPAGRAGRPRRHPDGDRTTFPAAGARRKELTLQLCRRMLPADLSARDRARRSPATSSWPDSSPIDSRSPRRDGLRARSPRGSGLKVIVEPTAAADRTAG